MSNQLLEISIKMAEAHSYEHLRQLSELALRAMSLHVMTNVERLAMDKNTPHVETVAMAYAGQRILDSILRVEALRMSTELKSSSAELIAVGKLLESANDPEVEKLNRLFHTR